MAVFHKEKIRNIALIGHSGEGKTSLLEAILYTTKAIDRLGKVDEGSSVSDYDQEEISRRMSISLSMAYTTYKDYKINILDVPGFFDFEGELVAALSVADGAIVVTSATGALSVGAEKAIDYCLEQGIATMVWVNGVNRENSDYLKTVEAIKERYGNKIVKIELPIMEGNVMKGFVDVLEGKAFDDKKNEIAIPANLQDAYAEAEAELLEAAAESSDELLEKFFGGEALTSDEKRSGIKARTVSAEIIPVLAGVAIGNCNITNLLDHIVAMFPAADEVKAKPYTKLGDGSKAELIVSEDGKFAAQVFKTIVDPFVGKLLMFKVYRGKIASGDTAYNSRADETEKISALYILRGKKQDGVDALYAGDIGALAKLNYTSTGDTLCDPKKIVKLQAVQFAEPCYSRAIAPKTRGQEEKVGTGLNRLNEEDPTFTVVNNGETHQTVISGAGDIQIDVLVSKLKSRFSVEAELDTPRVAYREKIRKSVRKQGRHKKQTGGSGQFGDVHIVFEPQDESEDMIFAEEVFGGSVPKNFFPAVEKGLREACQHGVLAGYPVVFLKATLVDGSYHPVDSSEIAFKTAAQLAYKAALPEASPVLLEPIGELKVRIPDAYMGDIIGDLNKRRGRVMGMDPTGDGDQIVTAEVPMAEMMSYAIDLRSMSQSRGSFTFHFVRYEDCPPAAQEKAIAEAKALADAE